MFSIRSLASMLLLSGIQLHKKGPLVMVSSYMCCRESPISHLAEELWSKQAPMEPLQ